MLALPHLLSTNPNPLGARKKPAPDVPLTLKRNATTAKRERQMPRFRCNIVLRGNPDRPA